MKNLSSIETNPLNYSLTMRFKDRYFTEFLWPQKGERVLDLGCGIGYLLSLFNISNGQLYGIDISWESLLTARKFVDGFVIRGDVQKLPFKDNTFDRIIFADVVEHIPDDRASLIELVRICRKNAKIIISTPSLEGYITHTWLKHWLHGEEDKYQQDHRTGYTADSLRRLVESNNIRVNKISYTNYYLTEVLVGILKMGFFMKKRRYNSQNDLFNISNSKVFQIYRHFLFPMFYGIGKVEERIFNNIIKGHCLILCGTVEK